MQASPIRRRNAQNNRQEKVEILSQGEYHQVISKPLTSPLKTSNRSNDLKVAGPIPLENVVGFEGTFDLAQSQALSKSSKQILPKKESLYKSKMLEEENEEPEEQEFIPPKFAKGLKKEGIEDDQETLKPFGNWERNGISDSRAPTAKIHQLDGKVEALNDGRIKKY